MTSPEPCACDGFRLPSNSLKICEYGLPTMLASTLSRPRCGMPMTTSSSPCSAAWSIAASIIGMTVSAPSSENRFCPTYFVCRNVSNASAAFSLDRMYFCCATVGFSCLTSTRSCSHFCCSGSRMWVYSTPTWRQYASRSRPSTSRSFLCSAPAKPLTLNSRSRSHSVRPCVVHIEVGVAAEPGLVQPQRVDVGHQVAAVAVGRDQLDDAARSCPRSSRGCRCASAPARTGCPARGRSRRRSRRTAAVRGPCAGSRRTPRPG